MRISTAVSRHYRTGKIGSTSYYWFHKNTNPVLTTSMPYYPGRQQRFDLQVYFEGTWYSADPEYFSIGTNGKSAVELGRPVSRASGPGYGRPTSTAPPVTT